MTKAVLLGDQSSREVIRTERLSCGGGERGGDSLVTGEGDWDREARSSDRS